MSRAKSKYKPGLRKQQRLAAQNSKTAGNWKPLSLPNEDSRHRSTPSIDLEAFAMDVDSSPSKANSDQVFRTKDSFDSRSVMSKSSDKHASLNIPKSGKKGTQEPNEKVSNENRNHQRKPSKSPTKIPAPDDPANNAVLAAARQEANRLKKMKHPEFSSRGATQLKHNAKAVSESPVSTPKSKNKPDRKGKHSENKSAISASEQKSKQERRAEKRKRQKEKKMRRREEKNKQEKEQHEKKDDPRSELESSSIPNPATPQVVGSPAEKKRKHELSDNNISPATDRVLKKLKINESVTARMLKQEMRTPEPKIEADSPASSSTSSSASESEGFMSDTKNRTITKLKSNFSGSDESSDSDSSSDEPIVKRINPAKVPIKDLLSGETPQAKAASPSKLLPTNESCEQAQGSVAELRISSRLRRLIPEQFLRAATDQVTIHNDQVSPSKLSNHPSDTKRSSSDAEIQNQPTERLIVLNAAYNLITALSGSQLAQNLGLRNGQPVKADNQVSEHGKPEDLKAMENELARIAKERDQKIQALEAEVASLEKELAARDIDTAKGRARYWTGTR